MARLPVPGGDVGNWGKILNDFLRQGHHDNGSISKVDGNFAKLQLRRATASQWTDSNPTLAAGEIGIETDTQKYKIGDGVLDWNDLDYSAAGDPLPAQSGHAGKVLTTDGSDTSWERPPSGGTIEAENNFDIAGGFLTSDGKATWLTTNRDGSPTPYAVEKMNNAGVGVVQSVNGRTGAVTLGAADIGAATADEIELVRLLRRWGYDIPTASLGDVDDWALTAAPGVPTTWDTYDGGNVIVHPSVMYFDQPFNGYHWWAAATPYANADVSLENPCIFVSNDGTDWVAPPGSTNPLAPQPPYPGAFNSDPHLVQGPDGRLYIFYRSNIPGLATPPSGTHVLTSNDGIAWDEPVLSLSNSGSANDMSPCVYYDDLTDEWVLFSVERYHTSYPTNSNIVRRFTAPSHLGPWTEQANVVFNPSLNLDADTFVWHLDVRRWGMETWALCSVRTFNSGGVDYLCKSTDGGKTFAPSTATFGSDTYKSAMVPRRIGQRLYLDLVVGHSSISGYGATRLLAESNNG